MPADADALHFRATAEPSALRRLRAELGRFLEAAGASEDLRFDVTLAVSEAANNVLVHAFRHRTAPGALIVVGQVAGGAIRVVVRDDGVGLQPRSDSPGAGLGLPLMAQLSDELSVARAPQGGTAVELRWSLARGS